MSGVWHVAKVVAIAWALFLVLFVLFLFLAPEIGRARSRRARERRGGWIR